VSIKAGPKSQVTKKLFLDPDPVVWFETVSNSKLYEWQAKELRVLAGAVRPRAFFGQVARKNGKSRLAAALVLFEACNKQARHIFLIADSERNLNSVLMRELRDIISQSDYLRDSIHIYKNHIEVPETGSTIETRASNFQATQGINPHLVIFDEVHLQKSDEIITGMQMAGAARADFLLCMVTTPGYDLTSPAHSLYQAVKAGDPTLYGVVYEPEDLDSDITDESLWPQSNPILNETGSELFLDSMRFDLARVPENDFRRFRLGMWTAGSTAWLPHGAWDACKSLTQSGKPDPGTHVWLGFDGSYSGDSTALVGCTPDGYVWIEQMWENPGNKGWRVPRHEVEDAVAMAMARYKVIEMLCDPPYWATEIHGWTARFGEKRVIEFPTFSRQRMAPACTSFFSAVLERSVSHDGNPALARHVANAIVKPSPQGDYITKADRMSPAKIDAAVAAIMAYSRACVAKKPRTPLFIGR
jgi:phage terminase large subunit-like protein